MSKYLQILIVVAFFVILLVISISASAWTNRLTAGKALPTSSVVGSSQQTGNSFAALQLLPSSNTSSLIQPTTSRPQGTVITTNPVVTLSPGVTVTVGSCATVLVQSASAGKIYTAAVIPETNLGQVFPGQLLSCGIEIEASQGSTVGTQIQICFPIPPSSTGSTYYWNGTSWVKTLLAPNAGQSCVVVPTTAPNPLFVALFSQ